MRNLLYIFPLVLLPVLAMAQTEETRPPVVVMDKGTKKIFVQELGVAPSTTLYEVLQLFPELMGRDAQQLDTYSVSLDDQDVGSSKTNLLMQLTVSDVRCLEICDNASAAYAKNGATGSINIVSADLAEGVSGYALADASTEASTRLAGSVGYRTDKISLRANFSAEYLRLEEGRLQNRYADNHLLQTDDYYFRSKGANEGVKINLDYRPTSADLLSVRLWQNYNFRQDYTEDEEHDYPWLSSYTAAFNQHESTATTHRLTLLAQTKYEHLFAERHKLGMMLNYNYGGNRSVDNSFVYTNGMDSCFEDVYLRQMPHQMNMDVYFDACLMREEQHTMNIKAGVQGNYTCENSTMIDSTYRTDYPTSDTARFASWAASVSPYVEYNYSFSQWITLNIGGRYRYEQMGQGGLSKYYHNYMLNIFLTTSPAKGHTIRLGALRNFLSASFDAVGGYSYTANGRYVYDGTIDEHHLNTEAGLQYTRVFRPSTDDIFNVWQAHVSALWSYRWASLALSFSLFDNQQYHNVDFKDYKGYYHVRLTPIFRLPKQWQLSATLLYSSDQITQYLTIGRYFYTALRLEKQVGAWTLHGELTDIAHYKTTNTTQTENMGSEISVLSTGYPYHRVFRLGVQYRF